MRTGSGKVRVLRPAGDALPAAGAGAGADTVVDGELDLVVDDYMKRPLLIAGRLLFQVALFDRPGGVNHLLGVIGRLQHPGRILCKADSDCRRCAALVRSSYLP